MANQEHLDLLKQGVEAWNQWRAKNPTIQVDLSGVNLRGTDLRQAYLYNANLSRADLSNVDLRGANLTEANLRVADLSETVLSEADLSGADLRGANLSKANLSGAALNGTAFRETNLNRANFKGAFLVRAYFSEVDFGEADFSQANLSGAALRNANLSGVNLSAADLSRASLEGATLNKADLSGASLNDANLRETHLQRANLSKTNLQQANLSGADLSRADLSGADLLGANLQRANLSEANFTGADLSKCRIYAISVWNVRLENAVQSSLIITAEKEPIITVDNLEVAQFIYLLLNNQKIRQTIDTITSQVALLLGSFPPYRKEVVDALSQELRNHKYLPVVFNFEGVENKGFTATARTLANMARFVLLDLTGLDDAITEIGEDIVSRCIVPIQPLLLQGSHPREYERFRKLQHQHRWVLVPYRYKDLPDLQSSFQEKILQPIYEKVIELEQKKPLKVFIGYTSEDKEMLNTLKIHLRLLESTGVIELWDDQNVAAGEEPRKEIERQLSDARIILLLISPDFLSSHDCRDIQGMAMERHRRSEARVIPVILRPCGWQSTPLQDLQQLPTDGMPISKRGDKDEVFFEVSKGIGEVIKSLR